MASPTSALTQIGSLVERLEPIAGKSRGMAIEAEDWNLLVEVLFGLLELERAQETTLVVQLADAFAARHHEHAGEIGIGALDTELTERLGGGGGGVPMLLRMSELQTRLGAVGGEVSRLTTLVETLQAQLDRSTTNELERSAKLRGFEERFTAVEDLRGVVKRLSGQVAGLQQGIDAVIELRDKLADVDPADLQTRVAELEEMRRSLLGADGRPLRLRDFELTVSELQEAVGASGTGALDKRMAAAQAELESKLDAGIKSSLAAALDETRKAVVDVREELEGVVASRVDDAQARLAQASEEAETRAATEREELEARVTRTVEDNVEQLLGQLSLETAKLVDARIPDVREQAAKSAEGAVERALGPARKELATALNAVVDERLSAAETVLARRAEELEGRFEASERELSAQVAERVGGELPGLVDARTAAAAKSLATRVDAQLTLAREALATTLGTEVGTTVFAALRDLDQRIAAQLAPQLETLDRRVAEAVEGSLREVQVRIDESESRILGRVDELVTQKIVESQERSASGSETEPTKPIDTRSG